MDTSIQNPESGDARLLQAGYRYALALTHHREEAEDLVQETWLNLCRRYGSVENQAILFSALRNLFIDQCRRKKIVQFSSLDHPDVAGLTDLPGDEPCVKGELSLLLSHLRPAEREAIFLHYVQGHTAEEISGLTAQSRGTVLSLLHRSLAKLRKIAGAAADHIASNQFLLPFVLTIVLARLLLL